MSKSSIMFLETKAKLFKEALEQMKKHNAKLGANEVIQQAIDFGIERPDADDEEDDEETTEDAEERKLGILDNALGRMDNVQRAEDFPEELDQQIQQQEMPQTQSLLGAR